MALLAFLLLTRGLPPPTRGILYALPRYCQRFRSTPAHAGNTPSAQYGHFGRPVYPRPRGEYETESERAAAAGGLPPPTRGIPDGV